MRREVEIPKLPTERKWFKCPHCGKNIVLYDDTAICEGVYILCKGCKKEIEINIFPD